MELVLLWATTSSKVAEIQKTTMLSTATIIDWLNLSREVCSHAFEAAPKVIGTLTSLIDEAYFRGKRCKEILACLTVYQDGIIGENKYKAHGFL